MLLSETTQAVTDLTFVKAGQDVLDVIVGRATLWGLQDVGNTCSKNHELFVFGFGLRLMITTMCTFVLYHLSTMWLNRVTRTSIQDDQEIDGMIIGHPNWFQDGNHLVRTFSWDLYAIRSFSI